MQTSLIGSDLPEAMVVRRPVRHCRSSRPGRRQSGAGGSYSMDSLLTAAPYNEDGGKTIVL